MRLPTTEAEWLNAVQTNRADTARAVLAGRNDTAAQLREDLGLLEAHRQQTARPRA